MTMKNFNAYDVARAVMRGKIIGGRSATGFFENSRRDMQLALAGGMPHRFEVFQDHFKVDTINLDNYLLTKDTNATDFAFTAIQGGGIAGSTGTNNSADGHSLWTPNIWSGDKNAWMLVTMKLDVVTAMKWEVGFADALSDKTLGAITDVDTPTNAFGDGAVLGIETGQTYKKFKLVTEGSTPYTIAATTLGSAIENLSTPTDGAFIPTAATYYNFLIATHGDDAQAMIFDANMIPLYFAKKAGALEGGTALSGWVFVATSDANAHVCTITDIVMMQDR